MAYFAPFIDDTGLHIPSYEDIRDKLISEMQTIFGEDIYIDIDSMDYQQIAIQAKKIYDVYNLALRVYNDRTPVTAIGVGLDNDVAYAGIRRKPATFSTVNLTITGDAGTVITNGEASDGVTSWMLPETVTIPSNGLITVEAKSKEPGNVGALPNTISTIVTPVYGWTSVINNFAAAAGTDVETDASLRGRFGISTRSPAQTVFEATWAALENIEEVTRVRGYENDTGATSTGTEPPNTPANLPPHSITFVVEGGDDTLIATEIMTKKTPGCYTNGTTEVSIVSIVGNSVTIRFYRPTYKKVWVRVNIKKLPTYNDEYTARIQQDIVDYINNNRIAEPVYRSAIWSVAMGVMGSVSNISYSVTDVQFSTDGTTFSMNDVDMLFYEAAQTELANVQVVLS